MANPPQAVGLIYNNSTISKATAVTTTNDYGNTLKTADYPSSVVTINASPRTKAINITGNDKNNKILGGSGNDTLAGGTSNDTLTGGDGADVFIYSAGKDVITDFSAQDTLKISSGSVSAYSISGNDATFKIGSGTVNVKGGKNTAITVVDSKNKTTTYDGGLIYDGTVAKAKAMTVSAAYGNTLAAYGASVVTIDSSARTKALNITGNAANNKIIGTSGNDTINGGAGNDTLTGGKGNDIFIYEAGNDVLADYAAGQNTIKIASGEISSYSFSGNDAVLKIGKGSVKVAGGKNLALSIVDAGGNFRTYQSGLIYDGTVAKAKSVTVTSAYGNTLAAYGASVETIDAAARTSAINITGNAANNFISGGAKNDVIDGGKGNDSIQGGKGNDTLTGGAGKDIFIYSTGDGNDVITDYVAGEDKIKIVSGSVTGYSVKNSDAILKIGSGTITLKNAGASAISVLDKDDNIFVYDNGLIYNNTKISKATAVTITSDYEGEFGRYGASVETIDAAARSKAVEITGNTGANYILGGKGKDTIDAGKGDDIIIGGKGNDILTGGKGDDIFYFGGADGNDTITDYSAGDIISVGGAVTYSTKNSDAILKIGTGNVTVQNAADMAITIVGADSVASIYSGDGVSTETYTGSSGAHGIAETVTVTVTVTETVTVPATTEVTVPAGGSVIAGTSEADELFGTAGNDTVSLGGGADVYIYEGGGDFDIITDYTAGEDKISIGANSVSGGAVVGDDVLFMINGGVLKLDNAKGKFVTIISGDTETEYLNGKIPGADIFLEGETVTLGRNYSGNFSLSAYNATVETTAQHIDATNVINSINIYGDNNSNIIRAGRKGGEIHPGLGDDIIYFGNGDDALYIYEEDRGDKIVYNYREEDKIYLWTSWVEQFSDMSLSGEDVILNLTNGGTITLKDARNKNIYIHDRDIFEKTATYGRVTISGDTISLASNYNGYFNSAFYAEKPTNIDASSVTGAIEIHGDDEDNLIRAGRGGSSIYAGKGNDTIYASGGGGEIHPGIGDDIIYFGNGDDALYIYEEDRGDKIVYNYREEDKIYLWSSWVEQFSNMSLSGEDVILNLINGGTITLKDARNKNIYIHDRDIFEETATYGRVTISGDTISLASNYNGYFNSTFYAEKPVNIDASSVTGAIEIHGDDEDNLIRAGRGGSSIYAGKGDDTIYASGGGGEIHPGIGDDIIYFGNGDDELYIYEDDRGDKIVYNYREEDKIYLWSSWVEQFSDMNLSGEDVILNLTNGGTITLKDARNKNIYIHDRDIFEKTATYGRVTISGDTISLASNYNGYFNSAFYAEKPTNIDASSVTGAIEMHGDDEDNLIRAGRGGSSIYAGKGNDTIYCGGGDDIIHFSRYGAHDTVYNIGNGDQIQLHDCSAQSVSVSGSDVIITTNYAETITLKDGTGKNIYISGQDWQTYSAEVSGSSALFIDDNFDTGNELDSIIDSGGEITNLNFRATNFENLAPEISYSGDK